MSAFDASLWRDVAIHTLVTVVAACLGIGLAWAICSWWERRRR